VEIIRTVIPALVVACRGPVWHLFCD